jgi:hypothetical protein
MSKFRPCGVCQSIWVLAAIALLGNGVSVQAGPFQSSNADPVGEHYAGADPAFRLTWSGNGISGSALLNAIDEGNGTFLATSGSGSVTGAPTSGSLTLVTNPTPGQLYTYSQSG